MPIKKGSYRGREASFAYIALMIASPFGPMRRSNDSPISGSGTSMPHLALPLPEKVRSQPSCRNVFFLNFSYVCPEPVMVKRSF